MHLRFIQDILGPRITQETKMLKTRPKSGFLSSRGPPSCSPRAQKRPKTPTNRPRETQNRQICPPPQLTLSSQPEIRLLSHQTVERGPDLTPARTPPS